MADVANTRYARFTKTLAEWLISDTTLCTLVGHAGSNTRILVPDGTNPMCNPSVLISVANADDLLLDVNGLFMSYVTVTTIGRSRPEALIIAGEVASFWSPAKGTQVDPTKTANNIRAVVQHIGISDMGLARFEATSVRRTERSDVTIPEVFVAAVSNMVRWTDLV